LKLLRPTPSLAISAPDIPEGRELIAFPPDDVTAVGCSLPVMMSIKVCLPAVGVAIHGVAVSGLRSGIRPVFVDRLEPVQRDFDTISETSMGIVS